MHRIVEIEPEGEGDYEIYNALEGIVPKDRRFHPMFLNYTTGLSYRLPRIREMQPNGLVTRITFYTDQELRRPAVQEDYVYTIENDPFQKFTLGAAISRVQTISWFFESADDGNGNITPGELNESLVKTNPKRYDIPLIPNPDNPNQPYTDNAGRNQPTGAQESEIDRRRGNIIDYLKDEAAQTPLSLIVPILTDTLTIPILQWRNDIRSTAFADAITSREGDFQVWGDGDQLIDLQGNSVPLVVNAEPSNIAYGPISVYDVQVTQNPPILNLQAFLLARLAGQV